MKIMTTKEKILNESIEIVSKRIAEIKSIIDANPLSDICRLRIEGQQLLDENKGNQRLSKEFGDKISAMAKKEKQLFALAKKQKNTVKLIDELVKLESELSEYESELWNMVRKERIISIINQI